MHNLQNSIPKCFEKLSLMLRAYTYELENSRNTFLKWQFLTYKNVILIFTNVFYVPQMFTFQICRFKLLKSIFCLVRSSPIFFCFSFISLIFSSFLISLHLYLSLPWLFLSIPISPCFLLPVSPLLYLTPCFSSFIPVSPRVFRLSLSLLVHVPS